MRSAELGPQGGRAGMHQTRRPQGLPVGSGVTMTWSRAPLGHQLAVWSWASHCASLNSGSSSAKWGNNGSYLTGLSRAFGEIICAKHLAQCPARG